MNRRALLAATATAVASGLAGCLDRFGADEAAYPTEEFEGETIPLAPMADVLEWYEADAARFVDTRGEASFEEAHVPGAVHSPGREGEDDPTAEWDRDVRIVTYCDCPHSLAVQRGSALRTEGFEDVYALDDGFDAWREAGHPVDGADPDAEVEEYRIEGRADPGYADEYVWIDDADGDSVEASRIDGDGRYEATIRSSRLTPDSALTVETPGYTVDATLAELTAEPVTADAA